MTEHDNLETQTPDTTVGKTRKSAASGKDVVDYVDKRELEIAINEYNSKNKEREAQGLPRLPMTQYIGDSILKIVNGLGSRYNFRNYSYLDEMKSDAIVGCVYAVHKFDSNVSNNSYGFLNFCAWRKMVNRIKIEKQKQQTVVDMMNDPSFEFFEIMGNEAEVNELMRIGRENSMDVYNGSKV